MKQENSTLFVVAVITFFVLATGYGTAAAEQSLASSLGVIPYPSRGQSPVQQQQDEGECFAWARQQTGIDPFAVASAPPAPSGPAVGGGERLRGAARGAAGGAIIGSVAGDTSDGLTIGAAAGALAGGRQARQNRQAKAQQAEDAKAGAIQHFNKAFGACLEGRGYVVK